MEKISLKVKILVQGMVPIEQFDIHQYVLNKNELQRDLVEKNEDDFFFSPLHLINAVMQESASKKAYFLTLDKENLDIYIPENILEDKERLNSFLTEEVVKIVLSLERELKILSKELNNNDTSENRLSSTSCSAYCIVRAWFSPISF